MGRFNEALDEQRRTLAAVGEEEKADYEGHLRRLEADIAALRDENDELRRDVLNARMAELDRLVAEIEQDPDVRAIMREER